MLVLNLIGIGVGLVGASLVLDNNDETLFLEGKSRISSDQFLSLRTLKDVGHHVITFNESFSSQAHGGLSERALISQKHVDAEAGQSATFMNTDGDRRIIYVGYAKSEAHGQRVNPPVLWSPTPAPVNSPFPKNPDVSGASDDTKELLKAMEKQWATNSECQTWMEFLQKKLSDNNKKTDELTKSFESLKSKPWMARSIIEEHAAAIHELLDIPVTIWHLRATVQSLLEQTKTVSGLQQKVSEDSSKTEEKAVTVQQNVQEAQEAQREAINMACITALDTLERSIEEALKNNQIPNQDTMVDNVEVLRKLVVKASEGSFLGLHIGFYVYALLYSAPITSAIRRITENPKYDFADLESSQGVGEQIKSDTSKYVTDCGAWLCQSKGVNC